MFFVLLYEFSIGNFILNGVPESLTLLAFGVGLVGMTAGLRRFFKRRDNGKDHNNFTGRE